MASSSKDGDQHGRGKAAHHYTITGVFGRNPGDQFTGERGVVLAYLRRTCDYSRSQIKRERLRYEPELLPDRQGLEPTNEERKHSFENAFKIR